MAGIWSWEDGKQWVMDNPMVTTLLAGMVALAIGFAAKVWKRLERSWVDSCADYIDATVRRILPRFRRRYYRQLIYRHRFCNVRGLRTQGTYSLELEKIFVQLRIAPQGSGTNSADPLRHTRQPGRGGGGSVTGGWAVNRSIWEILSSDDESLRCLAVIGPPGSGKTTLLQHLAITFAANRQRRYHCRSRAYVPIFLFLREHIAAIDSEVQPTLAELVTGHETRELLSPPGDWFKAKLESGRCLVLLDGLDEVANAASRRRVAAWVDRQCQRYGRCRFLVTSRPHGYCKNPLGSATLLEVQPFSMEDVRDFAHNWYLCHEILSAQRDDPGVRAEAEKKVDDLMRRLAGTPALSALAVNPLLLTMIALVHRYRGQLPERRIELYSEICDVLLGHWQAAKGLSSALTPAQKRAVLQTLALYMMEQGFREISRQEASRVISAPLARIAAGGDDPGAFFECLKTDCGLLVEREADIYSFAHLTFQEHLASVQLLELRAEERLYPHLADPWWHETVRLYVAQTNATGVIQACMALSADSESPVAPLALAYQCLHEARDVEPRVREALDQRVLEGLESTVVGRRRFAAEVLLTLRLQSGLARCSDDMKIDTAYLSCAEYQLFLDQQQESCEHLPPHWTQPRFPAGHALLPITGISQASATAFCTWLGDELGARGESGQAFRLPTTAEVTGNPLPEIGPGRLFSSLRTGDTGTWCQAPETEVLGADAAVRERTSEELGSITRTYLLVAGGQPPGTLGWCLDAASSKLAIELAFDRTPDQDLAPFAAGALTLAIAHQLSRARHQSQKLLTLVLEIAYDLARDIDLARDLRQTFLSARAFSQQLMSSPGTPTAARNLADTYINDLERAMMNIRNHGLARDIELARERARKIGQATGFELDISCSLRLPRACDRALRQARTLGATIDRTHHAGSVAERSCVRARVVRLASAADLAWASARARARTCTLALARACSLALELCALPPLERAVSFATALESTLRPSWTIIIEGDGVRDKGWLRTLDRTLDSVLAGTSWLDFARIRTPLDDDLPRTLDMALRGIARLVVRFAGESQPGATTSLVRHLLELWAGLALLRGRMTGELPAWESIRLVLARKA
jgi:energy-coupling factor transporter ATP-binding protein EcfA2